MLLLLVSVKSLPHFTHLARKTPSSGPTRLMWTGISCEFRAIPRTMSPCRTTLLMDLTKRRVTLLMWISAAKGLYTSLPFRFTMLTSARCSYALITSPIRMSPLTGSASFNVPSAASTLMLRAFKSIATPPDVAAYTTPSFS